MMTREDAGERLSGAALAIRAVLDEYKGQYGALPARVLDAGRRALDGLNALCFHVRYGLSSEQLRQEEKEAEERRWVDLHNLVRPVLNERKDQNHDKTNAGEN